jgi:hypothetical protein
MSASFRWDHTDSRKAEGLSLAPASATQKAAKKHWPKDRGWCSNTGSKKYDE